MRPTLRATCLLPSIILLVGCQDWIEAADRYREDFHYNYPLKDGKLEVESFNGSVEITGWDQEMVDISGTKYAATEELLREIKIDVRATPASVVIRSLRPSAPFPGRFSNSGVRYVIRVPRRTELARIATSNGSLRVEEIEGAARLNTSNGSVRTNRIRGALDVRTSNGSVELSNTTGGTTVHTSNGSIRAEVAKGAFDASTSNGRVDVRVLEADEGPVRVESSNGRIDVTMDTVRAVRASTSNASITLRLPSEAGANVRAHTSNARVTSDFQVLASISGKRNSLDGKIGTGGPLLDLTTSNGGIQLLRR
jgi:DUF4097 and DUF4098 domain-containing protein YvlB